MNIRKTKPQKGNKYYIRKQKGGYSTCIKGKPTDKDCDVLANCVGYANGAYNEEQEFGYEKYRFNCNAENFIEKAISQGLSVYKEPMVGGILVWQKGKTLRGNDGAGHVAICIEKINNNIIKTAESGYNSRAFWTSIRKNTKGNWGQSNKYKYRGCIAPLTYKKEESKPSQEPEEPTNVASTELSDKKLLDLVRKTIRGDFGTGSRRKNKLGSYYSKVMDQVNRNLRDNNTTWSKIKLYK